MKRRQQKISTILDKLYDQEEKEFVYLVKWEGTEYIHDTWEKESWLLQNAPDPLFKYNDQLGKFIDKPNTQENQQKMDIEDLLNRAHKPTAQKQPVKRIKKVNKISPVQTRSKSNKSLSQPIPQKRQPRKRNVVIKIKKS